MTTHERPMLPPGALHRIALPRMRRRSAGRGLCALAATALLALAGLAAWLWGVRRWR
jgi:hypothetical protein